MSLRLEDERKEAGIPIPEASKPQNTWYSMFVSEGKLLIGMK
jgi:hypothetical protein